MIESEKNNNVLKNLKRVVCRLAFELLCYGEVTQ